MDKMEEVLKLMRRTGSARKRQIQIHIPELGECGSCLYIGASPDRFEIVDLLLRWGYHTIDILEIWEDNVNRLREMNRENRIFRSIIHGDVRDILELIHEEYDVVMWWHGPEHIPKKDFRDTVVKIERYASEYVVIGCPWGEYPQGEVKGNKYEIHVSKIYKKDFEKLGYHTQTLRKRDKRGSNILAWRKM